MFQKCVHAWLLSTVTGQELGVLLMKQLTGLKKTDIVLQKSIDAVLQKR